MEEIRRREYIARVQVKRMNMNEDNKYWLRVNIESGSNDTPVKCQTTGTKIVRNV